MRRDTLMVLMLGLACQPATPAASAGQGRDRFDEHVAALRKTAPEGFHIVVQRPFVVIGDEPEAMVERRAARTVGWAVDRLKDAFFEHDPDGTIDIWLFKGKASYRKHTREIFNDDPGTNYAQARYLCHLQERGLLRRFYREFKANQKTDPTGYETLKAVLGEQDLDAFKTRWEKEVLKLGALVQGQ